MGDPSMEKFWKNILWSALGRLFGRTRTALAPASIDWRNIRSVLVIRPDRLGDVILATPVYESIKQSFPHIKVSALVDHRQAEILRDNPFVDRIVCFRHGHPLRIFRELNEERFDVAIVLNQVFSATAAALALFSRAGVRVGYENRQSAWVFHVNVPKTGEGQHEIQHNLGLLRFLGFPEVRDTPRVDFDLKITQKVDELLAGERRHPGRPLVLLKPGTRVPQWGWSLENFRAVTDDLLATGLAEVMIVCGPGEENLIASLTRGMLTLPVILPVLGVRELACLMRRADLLVCNHTGIMHLAAAAQTPVVAIFKHGDAGRWGPYRTRNVILEERGAARLSPETVLKNIRQMLPPPTS